MKKKVKEHMKKDKNQKKKTAIQKLENEKRRKNKTKYYITLM